MSIPDDRPTTACPPEEVPCDVCGVGWVDRYGRCDKWTCVLGGCQDEEEPA